MKLNTLSFDNVGNAKSTDLKMIFFGNMSAELSRVFHDLHEKNFFKFFSLFVNFRRFNGKIG